MSSTRTGSITPGKRADIVVLDATAINVTPIHDPVAAVVLCADVSNVEHVLVDGEFRKRDFRLTGDLAKAQTEVENVPRPPARRQRQGQGQRVTAHASDAPSAGMP